MMYWKLLKNDLKNYPLQTFSITWGAGKNFTKT